MFFNGYLQEASQPLSKPQIFPGPARGWVRNENLSRPSIDGAEILDNFFPTPEGCRLRLGQDLHAALNGEPVTHLAPYDIGGASKLFACDSEQIYDATTTLPPEPVGDVTGQSSGDYCSIQVQTTGGYFLLMFNGADPHQVYDGSSWAANTPAITGVDSADITFAWKFKSFIFMVEKNTTDAWYLPVGAIGGAATKVPLGGVFQNGGTLMLGATWSQDSGAGLDDYCLFISTEGDVAVYQGSNPASAPDWQLVGLYRIGRPLGKNAWYRSGGDILVVTDDGIVPMSSAVSEDRGGLATKATTYPIETAWRLTVQERQGTVPFTVAYWPKETMVVVGVPTVDGQEAFAPVMNSRHGAWCRFTNYDVRCITVFDNKLFFGTRDGLVIQAETGGSDQGDPYTGLWLPNFQTFNSVNEKAAVHSRLVARANQSFTPELFACADYQWEIPSAPNADPEDDGELWDSATWDSSAWGFVSYNKQKLTTWQSVSAFGHALSPGVQVTSGRAAPPDIEIIAQHLVYQDAEMMV